jgi:hypothetical protein
MESPLITRVDRPRAEGVLGEAGDVLDPWTWAVPLPYRALADPHGAAILPAAPTPRTDEIDAVGYFACLQSFLTYSLGWTWHDKGLIWWCDAGMPVDDPRFALIRDVWVADGLLETYIDWCSTHPVMVALDAFTTRVDHRPLDLPFEWRRRLPGQPSDVDPTSAYGKHLESGGHISGPSEPTSAAGTRLFRGDDGSPRATFVSDVVEGWYASLAARGADLPALIDDRSWRVDVFVKPIGVLGTYRRSRSTGLWFSGRHALHIVGN